MNTEFNLELYVVRNQEGKYFRAKGYNGTGDTWVIDINKARIYAKIGPARSAVTWFSNTFPQYGFPDILKLSVNNVEVLDEKARVQKAIDRKAKAIFESEKRDAQRKLEAAKRKLDDAQRELDKLKKK